MIVIASPDQSLERTVRRQREQKSCFHRGQNLKKKQRRGQLLRWSRRMTDEEGYTDAEEEVQDGGGGGGVEEEKARG